jgi:hypothetical protein
MPPKWEAHVVAGALSTLHSDGIKRLAVADITDPHLACSQTKRHRAAPLALVEPICLPST